MMKWIYPDVIKKLDYDCELFLNKELNVEQIQKKIYEAEHKIDSVDEV
ncbi:hypothetical protein [Testudinibacter sp. TR-2022]|nr:hypothetical protein [Testudinibacter sp. TR-2022]